MKGSISQLSQEYIKSLSVSMTYFITVQCAFSHCTHSLISTFHKIYLTICRAFLKKREVRDGMADTRATRETGGSWPYLLCCRSGHRHLSFAYRVDRGCASHYLN